MDLKLKVRFEIVKLSEEKIVKYFFGIPLDDIFLIWEQSTGHKNKNKQARLHETKRILQSNGNNQEK